MPCLSHAGEDCNGTNPNGTGPGNNPGNNPTSSGAGFLQTLFHSIPTPQKALSSIQQTILCAVCMNGHASNATNLHATANPVQIVQLHQATMDLPADLDYDLFQQNYANLIDELDLNSANKNLMLGLPIEKKWQIYVSSSSNGSVHCVQPSGNGVANGGQGAGHVIYPGAASLAPSSICASPEYYVDRLQNMMPSECTTAAPVKLYDSLKTALRTQPNSFVLNFLNLNGLEHLLTILSNPKVMHHHPKIIQCVKSLMNNSTGRGHVLAHTNAINYIIQGIANWGQGMFMGQTGIGLQTPAQFEDAYDTYIRSKVDILEILGAVCLVPGGHRKVLDSLEHLRVYAGERVRFQTILNILDTMTTCTTTKNGPTIFQTGSSPTHSTRLILQLKTALLSFLNAVLSYGPGQTSLEFRLHLRYELLLLGIEPILVKLKSLDNQLLDKHIDFFEQVRLGDEKEFARKLGLFDQHVDTKDPDQMYGIIKARLAHSYAYEHLMSIFKHLLLLPMNLGGPPPHHWILIDRLIQQIVLQEGSIQDESGQGGDCSSGVTSFDSNPWDHVILPKLDISQVVKDLEREETLTNYKERLTVAKNENKMLKTAIACKEKELETKLQKLDDMERDKRRLQGTLEQHEAQIKRLEEAVANNSTEMLTQPPPRTKGRSNPSSPPKSPVQSIKDGPKSSTLMSVSLAGSASSGAPPPPPPPPMPMGGLAGPPPPPPPLPIQMVAKPRKRNIPNSTAPLKSFNWAKLPENQVQGTLWDTMDEEAIYGQLDLKEIDRLFSAYQKCALPSSSQQDGDRMTSHGGSQEGGLNGDTNNHIPGSRTNSTANMYIVTSQPQSIAGKKYISVIDSRRAQNCNILLSKLKMTDEEICSLILSMDLTETLPLDMIEQLLKFTPTSDEAQLLQEHEMDSLARPDAFLAKISKIVHYEDRLKVLHYKKRFGTILEECRTRMQTVVKAGGQVKRSAKLKQTLSLVLALGNYMNRGPRGNASGFRLSSLVKLNDTKSNIARHVTLMNYLAEQMELKWPGLLQIEKELSDVKGAAKVSLIELDKDMKYLRNGMDHLTREVEFQRKLVTEEVTMDRFVPSVREFSTSAVGALYEVEQLFKSMKDEFAQTLALFGESSSVSSFLGGGGSTDEFGMSGNATQTGSGQNASPEHLFSILDQFLGSISEAHAFNQSSRRKKEDEEKRGMMKSIDYATLRRSNNQTPSLRTNSHSGSIGHNSHSSMSIDTKNNGLVSNNGGTHSSDFDDLISALRTGDVFTATSSTGSGNTNSMDKSQQRSRGGAVYCSSGAVIHTNNVTSPSSTMMSGAGKSSASSVLGKLNEQRERV